MDMVTVCDATMRRTKSKNTFSLTFKEKIELARLLDRLGVSVIEVEGIENTRTDSLRIKSIAAAVKDSVVAAPVQLTREGVAAVWNALKEAKAARLQVAAPVSTVQMEYIYHKKPAAMLECIRDTVACCREYTQDVEFIADDATRSDDAFLYDALSAAIEAGAKTVTVCDAAGEMLADEFAAFVRRLYENVPALAGVRLGVSCSDELSMADACTVAAVCCGAREIKTASYGGGIASLYDAARVLHARGNACGVACPVRITELKRITERIAQVCSAEGGQNTSFGSIAQDTEELILSSHDDIAAVLKAAERLGYDLTEEDGAKVWEAFKNIAGKKERVSSKELDAIIAAAAMQVPPAYVLDSYVINTGSNIGATAQIKLIKNGKELAGVSLGDGPIDAAFLAVEQIAGRHFELDDFQIQSVTEGREAMGQTVVKLLFNGRIYSGRGISTDILGASIMAYVSALNKIVYEEEEA